MSTGSPARCRGGGAGGRASASSASSVVTAPPSPVVTILRGWKERQPRSPSAPHGVPRYRGAERARRVLDERDLLRDSRLELLPVDRPAEEVHGEHGAASATSPPRRRARRRTRNVSGSTSTSTARAPHELDDVRGRRERVGRARSPRRPAPIPSASIARWSAAVPDETATASAVPTRCGDRALERRDLRAHRQLAASRARRRPRRARPRRRPAARGGSGSRHAGAPSRARYHAIVRSRPSSSSTRASKPSSSRAFSMFGIRSSTSA